MGTLVNLNYKVWWKVLTTKDFDIPQSRPRVYIVAVRQDSLKNDFTWPEAVDPAVMVEDLMEESGSQDRRQKSEICESAQRRLRNALKSIREDGGEPSKEWWFIDVDATDKYVYWMHDTCPCLTKSRGQHGFYVTKLKGMMIPTEIAKLQGYDPSVLRMNDSGISRSAWGKVLGDAMSLNVLQRVLSKALFAAGLAD